MADEFVIPKAKLKKIGNSHGIVIPKWMLKMLRVRKYVRVTVTKYRR